MNAARTHIKRRTTRFVRCDISFINPNGETQADLRISGVRSSTHGRPSAREGASPSDEAVTTIYRSRS